MGCEAGDESESGVRREFSMFGLDLPRVECKVGCFRDSRIPIASCILYGPKRSTFLLHCILNLGDDGTINNESTYSE